MRCPKCKHNMQAVVFEGVEVDRCESCQGIWFDAGEIDWLLGDDAGAALDTGDPRVGEYNNQIRRYRCPRCNGGMLRRQDQRATELHFEECTSCRGTFLDAGEFKTLIANSKVALRR